MTAFAAITEEIDTQLFRLPTCADYLYRWLLRRMPPGQPQEIELEDFQSQFTYSLKWIKVALQRLVDEELVELVKRYNGKTFKVVAWHPGRKNTNYLKDGSRNYSYSSKTEASKPDYSVGIGTNYSQVVEYAPPTHPTGLEQNSEATPILAEVEEAIAPHRMNANLAQEIGKVSVTVVRDAVARYQEYRERHGIERARVGLLVRAIRERWKPHGARVENPTPNATPRAPEGFSEWFCWAQKEGLVRASRWVDGDVEVLTPADEWLPWHLVRQTFKHLLKS